MDQVDRDYYLARIAAEEIAAQRATHPLAADTHRRLAEEYASLIVANDPTFQPRSISA
jgi:lipid-binding SYLF domain-containing protein